MASMRDVIVKRWAQLLAVLANDKQAKELAESAYSVFREVIAFSLGLFLLFWLYRHSRVPLVPPTLFWVLMVIPGMVGLLYHFVSVSPRFRARQASVDQYRKFVDTHDVGWRLEWDRRIRETFGNAAGRTTGPATPPLQPAFDNLATYSPSAAAALWAAIVLTAVFSVAAMVADSQTSASAETRASVDRRAVQTARPAAKKKSAPLAGFPQLIGQVEIGSPTGDAAVTSTAPEVAPSEESRRAVTLTATAAVPPTTEDAAKWRQSIAANALNGFLFAALGAYISVLWRMMMRINANALTYRFMFTAALRSSIAMIIGLAAGQLDLFGFVKANGPREALFFLAGLFTDWAIATLRARARDVFQRGDAACDRLPLCLVDGLDDGVIDILDEIGIWDVQHLATMDAGELTMRTLLPFNRVLDWIDQAILISCIREKIRVARDLGIRGAIDVMSLYSYIRNAPATNPPTDLAARSQGVLKTFADKSGMGEDAVQILASGFWFDYTVNLLYSFWQRISAGDARAGSAVP